MVMMFGEMRIEKVSRLSGIYGDIISGKRDSRM